MKEVVQLLGLTEDQGKIYFSVLSLGTATLGQISLLSGLDYLKTQDALEVLVGSNLVRRISGKVGRYVALAPFLKAFLLTYDPITLVNIRKESVTGFETQIDQISELLTKEIEAFSQYTGQLEGDFLKGLEPVLSNFTSIEDSVRGILNTSEQQILASAQKLQSTGNQLISRSKKFTDEVKKANLEKVIQIPELFQSFIPQTEKALEERINNTKLELDNITSTQKADLQILKTDLSRNLQAIITEVRSTDQPQFQESFEKSQKSVLTQIGAIEQTLELHHHRFLNALQDQNQKFLKGLKSLMDTFADDYRREIEIHYEKSGVFDSKSTELGWSIQEIDNMVSRSITGLSSMFSKVDGLQKSFNQYISGFHTFISSFAETQRKIFAEALNKAKKPFDMQIRSIENQLEQEVSALIFSIRQMKQNLNKIVQISQLPDVSGIDPTLLSTDLVVGEPVIIMLLRDLTVRAKASLTILMPRPELQTLIQASKLPYRTRVSIIGDFQKVPRSTLKKILSAGNTRLKQLDSVDYWACIRDTEEMLICPEPQDPTKEELIGVISTNANLVELFSQEVITYTTRSREILLQDIE
jgi:sugar-specific transcriptional regulator TrmB